MSEIQNDAIGDENMDLAETVPNKRIKSFKVKTLNKKGTPSYHEKQRRSQKEILMNKGEYNADEMGPKEGGLFGDMGKALTDQDIKSEGKGSKGMLGQSMKVSLLVSNNNRVRH